MTFLNSTILQHISEILELFSEQETQKDTQDTFAPAVI